MKARQRTDQSRVFLQRQRDIDNENAVLLKKIMGIMMRKNKSLTHARKLNSRHPLMGSVYDDPNDRPVVSRVVSASANHS